MEKGVRNHGKDAWKKEEETTVKGPRAQKEGLGSKKKGEGPKKYLRSGARVFCLVGVRSPVQVPELPWGLLSPWLAWLFSARQDP